MRTRTLAIAALLPTLLSTPASAGAFGAPPGDCNGSLIVEISDVVTGVNVAIGAGALAACPSLDANGDGQVRIDEVIALVRAVLNPPPPPFGGDCGNFVLNADEQCDDGNGDSAACDSGCRFAGPGILDQTWRGIAVDRCGGATGTTNIGALGPMFQEFVPSLPTLTAVLVAVSAADQSGAGGAGRLRIQIRAGSVDGPIIGAAETLAVPPNIGIGWQRLPLPVAAAVIPGATYLIEVSSPDQSLMLVAQQGEGCPHDGYAAGSSVGPDGVHSNSDWLFATFGSVE